MNAARKEPKIARENMTQGLALALLLLMGGWALAGPSGVLAWSENQRLLSQRQTELTTLVAERDTLKNRVSLLDPRNADADLAGELLRRNLNVVHPDEMVIMVK